MQPIPAGLSIGVGQCEHTNIHVIITIRKRSCGKVILSQACVKKSVHRGGGGYGTHPTGMHSCSIFGF